MPHPSPTTPSTCVTCEFEIVGSPIFHVGLPFCCAGCVANGPCSCSYDQDAVDDATIRWCRDVAMVAAAPARLPDRQPVGAAGRR